MFDEGPQPPKRSKYEQLILVLLAIGIATVTTLLYVAVVRLSDLAAG